MVTMKHSSYLQFCAHLIAQFVHSRTVPICSPQRHQAFTTETMLVSAGFFSVATSWQWIEKLTGVTVLYIRLLPYFSDQDKVSSPWLTNTSTPFPVPSKASLVSAFRACHSYLCWPVWTSADNTCLEMMLPCSCKILAPRWHKQCPCQHMVANAREQR